MSLKIAINGFGAIGRRAFRSSYNNPDLEFVAFNDLTEPRTLAHLLKYDSNYGIFNADIKSTENEIVVDSDRIKVYAEKDPANLPWKELGVDIVIESTGFFTDANNARKHLDAGAKKVIISAPAKNEDLTIVLGVNEDKYDPLNHNIVSNASCTTNCLAPLAKVLNDNFGIKKGLMTTTHSYTADQRILDAPHAYSKITRARAAAINMVPTTTGAAKATSLVLPELEGKLDGMAIRVPTPTVSIVDLVVDLEKNTSVEEVNTVVKKAAEGEMRGILAYNDLPLVSRDFLGNPNSSIFDANYTRVINGNMLKVLSWYDNEWGYATRVIDLALFMEKKGL
jgi:glyceraldehyde 3-phosphate dehydrogenase